MVQCVCVCVCVCAGGWGIIHYINVVADSKQNKQGVLAEVFLVFSLQHETTMAVLHLRQGLTVSVWQHEVELCKYTPSSCYTNLIKYF